jgi:hypothetical protein
LLPRHLPEQECLLPLIHIACCTSPHVSASSTVNQTKMNAVTQKEKKTKHDQQFNTPVFKIKGATLHIYSETKPTRLSSTIPPEGPS